MQWHFEKMQQKVPALCLAVPPIQADCRCGAHGYLHKSPEHCSMQYSLPTAPYPKNFKRLYQVTNIHIPKLNSIKILPNEPS